MRENKNILCTVVLNNYNYGNYILHAVESVLNQSFKDFELIIIDDGSTDNSRKILERYNDYKNVLLVFKKNGGQLSTFNEALKHIKGSIVFFLDSDDWFEPDYLMKAMNFYQKNPDCDFLTVNMHIDGDKDPRDIGILSKSVGYSCMRTWYLRHWLGGPTSSISIRSEMLKKILPVPYLNTWRISADTCLVYGASLLGAKKYFLNERLVHYQVHGENNYYGKKRSRSRMFKNQMAISALFQFFIQENNLMPHPNLFLKEFEALPELDLGDLFVYLKVILAMNEGFIYSVYLTYRLVRHYLRSRFS